jgi:hypothetical protein
MIGSYISDNVILIIMAAFFIPAIIVFLYKFRKKTDRVLVLSEALITGLIAQLVVLFGILMINPLPDKVANRIESQLMDNRMELRKRVSKDESVIYIINDKDLKYLSNKEMLHIKGMIEDDVQYLFKNGYQIKTSNNGVWVFAK